MKKLSHLLSAITVEEIIGRSERDITALECDSRKIVPGALFVAVKGVNVDAHKFIPLVTSAGASAIVCEDLPERLESTVTYIKVPDSAVALGFLASQWFDNPSHKLKLVGVTGTNGKTTTATLIYEMARNMGFKAGLLSTVCNYVEDEAIPTSQTTPDPLTLNALLARMVEAGCSYAAMEVSSHAAHQHRIAGLRFAGGVFTNLTRDHLDYHKTVDAYLQAKKSFFDNLPADAFALSNLDDKVGEVMLQNTAARRYYYSLREPSDFSCRIVESRLDGTLLSINGHEMWVMFTGRYNAQNLTAVYGVATLLRWDPEKIMLDMSLLVPVAGRFQTFRSPNGQVTAVVDYAHTPDALVNVLTAIRDVMGANGRIITVVGAGGNRDHGKRPIMAREAASRSNFLILTSDNPRDEQPDEIISQMEDGLEGEARKNSLSVTDRRQAIRTAARMAQPGDVILVAGKGHETYQEVKGVKHHFDDREEVVAAMAEIC